MPIAKVINIDRRGGVEALKEIWVEGTTYVVTG